MKKPIHCDVSVTRLLIHDFAFRDFLVGSCFFCIGKNLQLMDFFVLLSIYEILMFDQI